MSKRNRPVPCFSRALAMLAAVTFGLCAASAVAAPAAVSAEDIVRSVVAGTGLDQIAAGLDESAAGDAEWVNAVRLRLKAAGRAEDARKLMDAIAARWRTDAVLYNLGLSYVDQLPGHNLLRKGFLSTASVRVVDELLARHPNDWLALHIRGLNNLYWPDWFGRAHQAGIDLARAVEAARPLLTERPGEDGPAWTYLALGDALALQDQLPQARAAWAEGARAYPYFAALAARLTLNEKTSHAAVRADRDSDKPIDTDLEHLRSVSSPGFNVVLTGGILFGPGPLDDQPLHPGGLRDLRLARQFTGSVPQMNNGTEEPHLPGEIAVGKVLNGLFSDGTPANKNVDVGHVFLMNGRFKLFLAALDGGPNHGNVRFYLDRFWNWTIHDDIGIDPGFPEGVIKFDNFMFSTSPRLLPASTQTQGREPGGVDRAGSLVSGAFVPGLLGDDDEDGKLDGTFNAIGSFPLDSVFLPGAPFAQTRVFRTDIAIAPEMAGFLTLANAVSHLRAAVASSTARTPADRNQLEKSFHDRLMLAARHFAKAGTWVDTLDPATKAAYVRLTAPASASERSESTADQVAHLRFICAADSDLAAVASQLGLIRNTNDGSRLADLVKCGEQ